MANKASEVSQYPGNAYENYAGFVDNINVSMSPEFALEGWKKSHGHHVLIINQEGWSKLNWQSLGVGFYGNHVVMWLGEEIDPYGAPDVIVDCNKIENELLKNECFFDNASYFSDSTNCQSSLNDVEDEKCIYRTKIYECAMDSLDPEKYNLCIQEKIKEDYEICKYVYTLQSEIDNCVSYGVYYKK